MNLKCYYCGIDESECSRFYKKPKISDYKPVCNKHYKQLETYGKILERTKFDKNKIVIYDSYAEIELYDANNNIKGYSKIDLEDIELAKKYKWGLSSYGYCVSNSTKNPVFLHRLIMKIDKYDKNNQIDHINNNKLDNRKANLRVSSNQENSRNKAFARSNTGIIGVNYCKRDNVYQSHIKIDYKKKNLGQYKKLDEAIKARLKAEKKYFGEFSPQKHLFEKYEV